MDKDVFEALVGRDPRLKAMLGWRIALGKLESTEQVADYFKEDWNKVEDIYKRVSRQENKDG